jgi:DDE superfamily endonuclease
VALKPHLSRYWLTPGEDPDKDHKIADVCALYQAAPALLERGERTISTDEMTGVQALERKHPDLPLALGKVARREFEYIRHGTATFLLNFDVASGQVIAPTWGTTRTEADFLGHAQRTVATDPFATRWHFVCDNLNIHVSQSLVRWVAERDDLDIELGEFGKSGILHNLKTRAAFLSDPSHSIVFHYTPKHASWMNQIEIWLSILVRKVIRRGNFTSIEDVQAKVLAFIDYFNQTMAKPFAWTFKGKPLAA